MRLPRPGCWSIQDNLACNLLVNVLDIVSTDTIAELFFISWTITLDPVELTSSDWLELWSVTDHLTIHHLLDVLFYDKFCQVEFWSCSCSLHLHLLLCRYSCLCSGWCIRILCASHLDASKQFFGCLDLRINVNLLNILTGRQCLILVTISFLRIHWPRVNMWFLYFLFGRWHGFNSEYLSLLLIHTFKKAI